MNTSLIINSTDSNGKAYQKSISNINPEKANATLGEFAQMLNGLSTNTYVNASRVDKSDVTEEGGGGGSSKTEPTLTATISSGSGSYTYNGDGDIFGYVTVAGDPTYIKIDRSEKTFDIYSFGNPMVNVVVTLYASEGTNYAAKSVTVTEGGKD